MNTAVSLSPFIGSPRAAFGPARPGRLLQPLGTTKPLTQNVTGVTVITPGKVVVMDGERVVFTEESAPQHYIKLIASGEPDESLLEALEDYVSRQKRRLERNAKEKEQLAKLTE